LREQLQKEGALYVPRVDGEVDGQQAGFICAK